MTALSTQQAAVSTADAIKAATVALSLGDASAQSSFADWYLLRFGADPVKPLVATDFLRDTTVTQAIVGGNAAMRRVIDHYLRRLEPLTHPPAFSWSFPDAKVPGYPLVEEFLRSSA